MVLKLLKLYNSYRLETCYEYFLLHLLGFQSPAHFWYGRGKHAYYPQFKTAHFIPHFGGSPLETGAML